MHIIFLTVLLALIIWTRLNDADEPADGQLALSEVKSRIRRP